ncbi:MAG: hypothetical protein ABSF54_17925 [Bryobacteraceae bacterium]
MSALRWKTITGRFRGAQPATLSVPGALAAQSITIGPSYAAIGVKQTQQYQAAVTGLTNTKVTWEVEGVKGGNSTYGTMTSAGLYTAPAKIPVNGITITALGSDDKTPATTWRSNRPARLCHSIRAGEQAMHVAGANHVLRNEAALRAEVPAASVLHFPERRITRLDRQTEFRSPLLCNLAHTWCLLL